MTIDEAVHCLRRDPQYAGLVRDAYLGEDVLESAERFRASAEFAEVRKLLGGHLPGGKLLDLGAGNGIASYALAKCGAKVVYALEPEASHEVGRGAIGRLTAGLPVEVINAVGERIPLPDAGVDVVYARQALHHTRDLFLVLRECARVLKSGGLFLACREHVVDNERQLKVFLNRHPLHRLIGGENAFRLSEYKQAIKAAGLRIKKVMGPWSSVINAFPAVRTTAELKRFPRIVLERRFGLAGCLVSFLPGVRLLIWVKLKRPTPGRIYSFLAPKP